MRSSSSDRRGKATDAAAPTATPPTAPVSRAQRRRGGRLRAGSPLGACLQRAGALRDDRLAPRISSPGQENAEHGQQAGGAPTGVSFFSSLSGVLVSPAVT